MSSMNYGFAICILDEDPNRTKYIFKCVPYSLDEGDEVKVTTCRGRKKAVVVSSASYITDEMINLIEKYVGKRITGRVTCKFDRREFNYGDDNKKQ